jgi:glycerophosphoryl diester phosphodiesterase
MTFRVLLAAACSLAVLAPPAVAAPATAAPRPPGRPTRFPPRAPASTCRPTAGGLGLVTESTLEAFANALQLGVTTLELDVQITEDGTGGRHARSPRLGGQVP